jgi:hypothetical protein
VKQSAPLFSFGIRAARHDPAEAGFWKHNFCVFGIIQIAAPSTQALAPSRRRSIPRRIENLYFFERNEARWL